MHGARGHFGGSAVHRIRTGAGAATARPHDAAVTGAVPLREPDDDGRRRSGYPSPATIQGLNMPNRVVLAETVKAGDKFEIAIFGINGPISVAPANFIFFRQASIEFYK